MQWCIIAEGLHESVYSGKESWKQYDGVHWAHSRGIMVTSVLYFHSQHNRRVRMVDLKKIDFDGIGKEIVHIPLDRDKAQDIEDITPVIK